ncbi:MAG TPA: hypothetical protein VE818_09115, partial [Nitrososphaeraceae archaeon]|nr:hypothetical protein [Nitrososphaeraceae archaeon]
TLFLKRQQPKDLCFQTYLVKVIHTDDKENQKFMIIVKAILLIDIITEHENQEIYVFREYNMIRRICIEYY